MRSNFTLLLIILTLLCSLPVQGAELKQYSVEYDIILDKAIVEITLTFDKFHSQVEWLLPQDASAIEVPSGVEFEVQELENAQKVVIKGKLFNQVQLKYITGSVIEKTKDRFFILDLSSIEADTISVTVKLPEEANLKYTVDAPQLSIIPTTENIKTDGQKIIIHWDTADIEKAKSILVIYTLPQRMNPVIVGIIMVGLVIVFSIIGFVYFLKVKKRKHHKNVHSTKKNKTVPESKETFPEKNSAASNLTKNLFEEEKKIIEILLETKGNELWQKELAQKSGLSKVKLSRKIRNLEQKGLIEKIPCGNTNKIRVKKG